MAHELLADRYPEIYYALIFGQIGDCDHPIQSQEIPEPSEEIEVVYLFGLESGPVYKNLYSWLQKEPTRQLVILEDDLGSFTFLTKTEANKELLQHSQVHLRYVRDWDEFLDHIAPDFPCKHIEVLTSKKYAKSRKSFFARMRHKLLRNTALFYVHFSEALHASLINTNFFYNAHHLPTSFNGNRLEGQFEGIPAVICGAGPSLGEAAPWLNQLEDRAIIMAGGSAVTALGHLGIVPHLAFAIDPNHEEYERFKANIVQEVPLLYGHRIRHEVFSTFNGPLGYMRSATGGRGEAWLEEKMGISQEIIGLELGPEALSITTMALATAVAMKCNPIILIGVDLAYVDMQRYAPGVVVDSSIDSSKLARQTEHLDTFVKRKNAQGKPILTLIRWVMEAEALGSFAKKHSSTAFFNASEKGLCISHFPYLPFDSWIAQHCQKAYDLRGQIYAQAESLRFTSSTHQDIKEFFLPLKDSLHNLLKLISEVHLEILRLEKVVDATLDSGRLLALNMLCEEEVAFAPLLETTGIAFDLLKPHPIPSYAQEDILKDRQLHLNFLKAKWEHMEKSVRHYLTLLIE